MLTNNPYREIFRLTPFPMAILLVKSEDIVVYEANTGYLNLLQIPDDVVRKSTLLDLLHTSIECKGSIRNSILLVVESKEADVIEVIYTVSAGSCKVEHIYLTAGDDGQERIMQVITPISTQNHSTDSQFSLIINNTEEAFIVLNKELIITSFNERFSKLYYSYFGIQVVEGNSILLYAQEERMPLLRNLYDRVLQGNIEHSTIDLLYAGKIRKIALKYSPILDHQKTVTGVFVTAADVTAIKNFEVQLKTREQELSLIFENLTEIVFLINVEENKRFRFKSINKAFTVALALSKDEVEGKYVDEVIPEPSLSMVLGKYREAIANKKIVSWEETSIYPAGRKTGIVSVNPIFDIDGNCIELIGSVYDITDRVQASEQLGKIMDLSLDVICTIDKAGNFVTVSAAAERIWGYTPVEMIGNPFIDFVHVDDRTLTNEVAQSIMEGLQTTNFENRYIRKDGVIIPVIWSARWDEVNETMYCTAKDGTDRVRSEKQLQESEQRFKSLVQEGSDMIGILDLEGNYRYVSPTSLGALGIEPEELVGKNAFDFIHPDDAEAVFANFSKVGTEKRVSLSPFRFKHKDGTWRWIETVATDLLDDPAINGIVTNSRDVTHKINAEKATLLINERYNLVTKATSDAIWDWDLASNELYWGDGFQVLFGYKPTDLPTDLSSWSDRIHPDDAEKVVQSVYDVVGSDNNNWIGEYRYLKANGEYTFVQDRGFVIRDEQNKAIRMVGALEDISQRKKEEQQLKLLESVITNTSDAILIT
ncbi:MAG: PAS domain S-box protein, partial [Bacteroidia bacterium]